MSNLLTPHKRKVVSTLLELSKLEMVKLQTDYDVRSKYCTQLWYQIAMYKDECQIWTDVLRIIEKMEDLQTYIDELANIVYLDYHAQYERKVSKKPYTGINLIECTLTQQSLF